MKTMKYLSMLLMMALCVGFASCGEDKGPGGEEPQPPLPGTRWTFTNRLEKDGIQVTYDYAISFSTATAIYEGRETWTKDNKTETSSFFANYAYTYSDGLVVLTPQDANYYHLEGEIISNIKMVVTVVETNEELGIFYKQ